VYYAILVRMVSRSAVALQDCQIWTHRDDQIILAHFDGQEQVVDFGGQLYQKSEILNRSLESGLRVSSGQVVEGWILASGLWPIPADLGDFSLVPCELTFWDLFGREFSVDAKLSVLCAPQRCNPIVSRRSGLYGPVQPPELSVGEASRLCHLEIIRQEKEAGQQRAAGIPNVGVVGKGKTEETAERQQKLMKILVDFLGRADLDDLPSE
jgi:hypothetical protein